MTAKKLSADQVVGTTLERVSEDDLSEYAMAQAGVQRTQAAMQQAKAAFTEAQNTAVKAIAIHDYVSDRIRFRYNIVEGDMVAPDGTIQRTSLPVMD